MAHPTASPRGAYLRGIAMQAAGVPDPQSTFALVLAEVVNLAKSEVMIKTGDPDQPVPLSSFIGNDETRVPHDFSPAKPYPVRSFISGTEAHVTDGIAHLRLFPLGGKIKGHAFRFADRRERDRDYMAFEPGEEGAKATGEWFAFKTRQTGID